VTPGTKRSKRRQPDHIRADGRRTGVGVPRGRAARRGKLFRHSEEQQGIRHSQHPTHRPWQAWHARRTARSVQDHAWVVRAQVESAQSSLSFVYRVCD